MTFRQRGVPDNPELTRVLLLKLRSRGLHNGPRDESARQPELLDLRLAPARSSTAVLPLADASLRASPPWRRRPLRQVVFTVPRWARTVLPRYSDGRNAHPATGCLASSASERSSRGALRTTRGTRERAGIWRVRGSSDRRAQDLRSAAAIRGRAFGPPAKTGPPQWNLLAAESRALNTGGLLAQSLRGRGIRHTTCSRSSIRATGWRAVVDERGAGNAGFEWPGSSIARLAYDWRGSGARGRRCPSPHGCRGGRRWWLAQQYLATSEPVG